MIQKNNYFYSLTILDWVWDFSFMGRERKTSSFHKDANHRRAIDCDVREQSEQRGLHVGHGRDRGPSSRSAAWGCDVEGAGGGRAWRLPWHRELGRRGARGKQAPHVAPARGVSGFQSCKQMSKLSEWTEDKRRSTQNLLWQLNKIWNTAHLSNLWYYPHAIFIPNTPL